MSEPMNPAELREYCGAIALEAGVLAWQCDPDGAFTFTTPAWEDIVGCPPSEMFGHPLSDFQTPDVAERDRHGFEQLLRGLRNELETVLVSRNGSETRLVLHGKPMLDKAGNVVAIRGLAWRTRPSDPADRTERVVQENEHQLRLYFESVGTAITVFDREFRVLRQNCVARRYGRIPGREEIGLFVVDLLGPEVGPDVLERMKRVVASGAPEVVERRLQVPGYPDPLPLQQKWFRTTYQPVFDGADITGVMLVSADITEFKEAEAERQRLQHHVMKTEQLEALGILAGGIAHDFNNLLGGIFGFVELAYREPQTPAYRRNLAEALSAIDRARALTRQLITFTKGGEPVRSIHELFPLVLDTARFALSGSNIACTCEVAPGLHACSFDPHQISQVVDNLVINARQAMPDGGSIAISAQNVTLFERQIGDLPAGEYVRVSVRDTGTGIAPEVLPRVFDPFFSTKATGSGLGLATSHSIIRRHGGTIEVESKPAVGSVFHVYLPAAPGAEPASSSVPAPVRKGSGRILVMDDEVLMRDICTRILVAVGYEVEAVDDGRAAIEAVQRAAAAGRPFSAVLLDLTVPGGMGGKEAAGEIRKIAPALPLFVTSGYFEDPIVADPSHYGFAGAIAKPFRVDDLARLMAEHLQRD